jgi:hypothetical protein
MAILAALAVSVLAAGQAQADPPIVSATVQSTPVGQTMGSGYVGVSIESDALHIYTGRNPDAVNPVLIQLLKALAPGQRPVLRIGGRSTDRSWWPMRGVIPPGGITYALTKGWLRTTHALAAALRAKLILGINLASGRPALAAAEARALVQGIGRRYINAFEIGNEPDLYGTFAWYRDRRNRVVFARPRNYSLSGFIKDFSRWAGVLPRLPLVGPSFAELTWLKRLGRFISAEHRVRTVTLHRYPLRGCVKDPSDPSYASISNLLADSASAGMAGQVAVYAAQAHSRGLAFRLDEMNSAACAGRSGVSDTFASALWVLDTLFNLAWVGVDGVNLHTLPHAAYEPFSFIHRRGQWHAFVHPVYYGMLAFAQAFPPGARPLPVSIASGPVKAWATTATDGHTRVVLINKSTNSPAIVQLQVPDASGPVSIERLQAPSAGATSGVTLGGQSFGTDTRTGELAPPKDEQASPISGSYTISLPAASAALVTR